MNYFSRERGLHMKAKGNVKIDTEKAIAGLKKAIKDSDPLQKWLPALNELKPHIDQALAAGLSLTKIRKTLVESNVKVPHVILKKFISLNEKK